MEHSADHARTDRTEDDRTPARRASVVVPTYNRPEMIAACVAALQAQTQAIEIIVVDDGSPAPLPDLADGPHRLVCLCQDNAGPATARNRGAAAATTGLLIFTDDDCRPDPDWAAAFVRAAETRDRPTLFGGRTINACIGDIFADTSQAMNDYLSEAGDAPFFASNNIALRQDAFLDLGGFDTGYSRAAGEDRALCRAWAQAGYDFETVEVARLHHHHALSLQRFWRQHRNYGYGAARLHATAPGSFRPLSRLGFYAGFVTAPLRGGITPWRIAQSGLIGLAQIATIQGFRDARREAAR